MNNNDSNKLFIVAIGGIVVGGIKVIGDYLVKIKVLNMGGENRDDEDVEEEFDENGNLRKRKTTRSNKTTSNKNKDDGNRIGKEWEEIKTSNGKKIYQKPVVPGFNKKMFYIDENQNPVDKEGNII